MPGSNKKRNWLAAAAIGCALAASLPASAQTIRFIDTGPEQVGLELPDDAGLPEALWQGTSPERLAELLTELPAEVQSPARHSALVRLLRVSAQPPEGEPVTPSLASLRLSALARLGAEQDVLELAERIDPELRQAPYWQARADVGMLRYNLSGVCALPDQAGDQAATARWQRLVAFCRLLRGHEEAAMVAVMLADELGEDDAIFAQLFLARQFPKRAAGPPIMPAEPLHLTMARALKQPMASPERWNRVPGLIASGIARSPSTGLEPRTAAAERAVGLNVLPAELLIQLYLASELTTPLGVAYRQAAFATNAPQRQAALQAFWATAAKAGLYNQMAPFATGLADELDPKAAPPAFAGNALRTALVAGDAAGINTWQGALTAAAMSPEGRAAHDAAYLPLALAGGTVPALNVWWPAWKEAADPSSSEQALAAGLLEALGTPIPDANGPTADRSAAARAIAGAEAGEAALLALTALAEEPEPSPGLQVQAVEALARVSPADARAVALELAIAAGL